jgi:hypothetical protein
MRPTLLRVHRRKAVSEIPMPGSGQSSPSVPDPKGTVHGPTQHDGCQHKAVDTLWKTANSNDLERRPNECGFTVQNRAKSGRRSQPLGGEDSRFTLVWLSATPCPPLRARGSGRGAVELTLVGFVTVQWGCGAAAALYDYVRFSDNTASRSRGIPGISIGTRLRYAS